MLVRGVALWADGVPLFRDLGVDVRDGQGSLRLPAGEAAARAAGAKELQLQLPDGSMRRFYPACDAVDGGLYLSGPLADPEHVLLA